MKHEGKYYYWESYEDCAECLCAVCARNTCTDICNPKVKWYEKNCYCDCRPGSIVNVTLNDCSQFVGDAYM